MYLGVVPVGGVGPIAQLKHERVDVRVHRVPRTSAGADLGAAVAEHELHSLGKVVLMAVAGVS